MFENTNFNCPHIHFLLEITTQNKYYEMKAHNFQWLLLKHLVYLLLWSIHLE